MPGPVAAEKDDGTWEHPGESVHRAPPATRSVRQPKMSPETLLNRVLHDIVRSRDKIQPGTVGLLPLLMRLAPSYAARRVAST